MIIDPKAAMTCTSSVAPPEFMHTCMPRCTPAYRCGTSKRKDPLPAFCRSGKSPRSGAVFNTGGGNPGIPCVTAPPCGNPSLCSRPHPTLSSRIAATPCASGNAGPRVGCCRISDPVKAPVAAALTADEFDYANGSFIQIGSIATMLLAYLFI